MYTFEKIEKTWRYCYEMFGNRCIALCLVGSQNYELDLPDSDVDTKLIVAPSWEEIVNCREPKSQNIKGLFGEINVCDIRLFIGVNLEKQNFNFLETLFTPYSRVNQYYRDLWAELIEHREEIAHYRPEQAIRTMMGQVEKLWKRWGKFDNKKTLYHMMRITNAIDRYWNGLCFADTLIADDHALIMEVRLGKISQEEMEIFFNEYYSHAHQIVEQTDYMGQEYPIIYLLLDELKEKFVLRALKGES